MKADRKASSGSIFLLVMLDMVGFGMVLPSLPFLNQEVGGSADSLGWIIAGFSIGQFVASPFMGRLSDRIGRKPVLTGSIVISIVGNLIYGFAADELWLGISRFVAGFAAGNLSVARAYISEVTAAEKRTAAMGMIGAAFGIGFTLGPGLGALAAPLGLRAPGYFAAALGVLNLLYLLVSVAEPERHLQKQRRPVESTGYLLVPVLAIIFIYFVAISGFAGFETVGALVTQAHFDWGNQENGLLFAGAGVIAALVQGGLVRPLARRFDDRWILLAGYLLMAGGFALLTADVLSLPRFLVGAAAVGTGMSLAQPSMFSLYSNIVGPANQGAMMGWLHAGGSVARMVGPVWAGSTFHKSGTGAVFAGATTILIVACVVELATFRWLVGVQTRGASRYNDDVQQQEVENE